MQLTLDQRFADAMGQLLGPDFPTDIGLAVSGGGDSMAMLYLAHNWTHRWGVRLWVVTIDHGLRAESAAEAAMVARTCAMLGWPHTTLRWHWDGNGNVMDAARRGRLGLIDRWCGQLRHVLMAHTADDVAETFVMRLARGSGVDGLAAMAASRRIAGDFPCPPPDKGEHDGPLPPRDPPGTGRAIGPEGFTLIRPCLDMARDDLRHYLRVLRGTWVEDPTNDDPHYDRARVRQARPALAGLGLTPDTLTATAHRMARARQALRARAAQVWDSIGSEDRVTGTIRLTRDGMAAIERDTQLRVLAAALQYVASAAYRPREDALEALLDRLLAGGAGTLHGCMVRTDRDAAQVLREPQALEAVATVVGDGRLWDGRWQVFHNDFSGMAVRALGEAGWRHPHAAATVARPPHAIAITLPAIWDHDRLMACDALGLGPGNTTRLCPMGRDGMDLRQFLVSH